MHQFFFSTKYEEVLSVIIICVFFCVNVCFKMHFAWPCTARTLSFVIACKLGDKNLNYVSTQFSRREWRELSRFVWSGFKLKSSGFDGSHKNMSAPLWYTLLSSEVPETFRFHWSSSGKINLSFIGLHSVSAPALSAPCGFDQPLIWISQRSGLGCVPKPYTSRYPPPPPPTPSTRRENHKSEADLNTD